MKTVCIMCPMGCPLDIENKDGNIIVSGNGCLRGKDYGIMEITKPVRVVTSVIKGKNYVASIKTTVPIDKTKIVDVLNCLKEFHSEKVKTGEIIIKNVAETGSDIIVTGVFSH